MKKYPTRAEMILATMSLLHRGTRPSALPSRLMVDYGLSREATREIAGAAFRRWLAAKPGRGESNGDAEESGE